MTIPIGVPNPVNKKNIPMYSNQLLIPVSDSTGFGKDDFDIPMDYISKDAKKEMR